MSDGGVELDGDEGRRRLVAPVKAPLRAALPVLAGLYACAITRPSVGIPASLFFGSLAVVLFCQVAYPAIVLLDEEGFTIETGPWRRPQLVRWSECSAFTVHPIGVLARAVPNRATISNLVRYTSIDDAKRRTLRSRIGVGRSHGKSSVLPPNLDRRGAEEVAGLFNRYRGAHGRTADT